MLIGSSGIYRLFLLIVRQGVIPINIYKNKAILVTGDMTEGRCARLYDPFFGLFLKPVYRAALDMVRKYHCTRILDMGCGTGAQCTLLGIHGFTVVGIDRSEKMLDVARSKDTMVTYLLSDASRTHLPDNYFDCAILSFVIHTNTPAEMESILAEARRVVKPEGMYILADYGIPSTRKERLASRMVGMIEHFAMEEHKKNYLNYMKLGGIHAFVKKHRLSVVENRTFYAGTIEMVAARW